MIIELPLSPSGNLVALKQAGWKAKAIHVSNWPLSCRGMLKEEDESDHAAATDLTMNWIIHISRTSHSDVDRNMPEKIPHDSVITDYMIVATWLKGVDCIECIRCERLVKPKTMTLDENERLAAATEMVLGRMNIPKLREDVTEFLSLRFRCSVCGGKGKVILEKQAFRSLIRDDFSDLELDDGYSSGTRAYDPDSGECDVDLWEPD